MDFLTLLGIVAVGLLLFKFLKASAKFMLTAAAIAVVVYFVLQLI